MRMTFYVRDVNGIADAKIPIELSKTSVLFGPNGSGKTRILNIINDFYEGKISEGIFLLLEFSDKDVQDIPYFISDLDDHDYTDINDPEWNPLLEQIRESFGVNIDDPEIRRDIEGLLMEVPYYEQIHPFHYSGLVGEVIGRALKKRIEAQFREDAILLLELEEKVRKELSEHAKHVPIDSYTHITIESEHERLLQEHVQQDTMERMKAIKKIGRNGETGIEHLAEPIFNCRAFELEIVNEETKGMVLYSTPCLSEGEMLELETSLAWIKEQDQDLYEVVLGLIENRESIDDPSYICLPDLRSQTSFSALPSLIFLRIEEGMNPIQERLESEAGDYVIRFVNLLNSDPELMRDIPDDYSEEEFNKFIDDYADMAKITFFREIDFQANIILEKWFPSLRLHIREDTGFMPKILIMRAKERVAPDQPPYDLASASSAERIWIALAIRAAIENCFQGRLEQLKYDMRIQAESNNRRKQENPRCDEDERLKYPKDVIDCDAKAILKYCEKITADVVFDELYESRLPMQYRAWKGIICIDEPELHLHASSQRVLAEQMQRMCSDITERVSILLATHSPYFLSGRNFLPIRTDAEESKNPMEVVTKLQEGLDTEGVRAAMGWTSGEFLIGFPHLLFVEGPSDKLFLEILYGDFLRSWNIMIIPLGGTARLGRLMNPLTRIFFEGTKELDCSLMLDRAQEKVYPYFVSAGGGSSKADNKVPELMDNMASVRKKNEEDEEERAFVECVEAMKCIEEMTGENYLELGFAREEWGWEKIITAAVREGDYRQINRDEEDLKKKYRSISSRLDKNPYISYLRMLAKDWPVNLHLLKEWDILNYLDMSVVGKVCKLDNETIQSLRSERKDIKEALEKAIGKYPGRRFINDICTEMVKKNPPTDGLMLNRSSPGLQEISDIIENIARGQGYIV